MPTIIKYNDLIIIRRRIGRLKAFKSLIDDKMENMMYNNDYISTDIELRIQRLDALKNCLVRQLDEEQKFSNMNIEMLQSSILNML